MNKEGDHGPVLRGLLQKRKSGEMTGADLRLAVARYNGTWGLSMAQAMNIGGIKEADYLDEAAPDPKITPMPKTSPPKSESAPPPRGSQARRKAPR